MLPRWRGSRGLWMRRCGVLVGEAKTCCIHRSIEGATEWRRGGVGFGFRLGVSFAVVVLVGEGVPGRRK